MKNLILSGFTDEYSKNFREQCEAAQRLGLGYIELRGVDGKSFIKHSEAELESAARMLEEYSLKVSSLGSPLGKYPCDCDRKELREKVLALLSVADLFGCKLARVFSFYLPAGRDRKDCRSDVLSRLDLMIDTAAGRGVTLCHENEADIWGESPDCCRELLEAFGGSLGCVFDMGNFVLGGYDPADAYRKLKKHINYFHIKDALFAGAIVPPGKGEAKIKEILSDYSAGSDGPFFASLEPHLETFDGQNALSGRHYDNPYKYETPQAAFTDAAAKFRELTGS